MNARAFFLFLICFWAIVTPAFGEDSFVVRVEDDGAIVVSEERELTEPLTRYLFYGVEVPTVRQPHGAEALAWLRENLPPGEKIIIQAPSTDSEGKRRALIQRGSVSMNYQLLYEGLAWVNRGLCRAVFCRRWYIQEHQAVVEKRGLWSIPMSTPPWQWSR